MCSRSPGFSRQQIGYDLYQMDPSTIDPHFYSVYGSSIVIQGGGGLLDIKKMQQLARAVNDSIYLGIGKVYEALVIGMAASIWGDIPYREAADSTNLTPAFDPQLQVYADVLAQLDSAILFLAATPAAPNAGPPADNAELIYRRSRRRRGRAGGGVHPGGPFAQGQVPHAPGRRRSDQLRPGAGRGPAGHQYSGQRHALVHDQSPSGQNVWWQFMDTRTDIAPGAAIVEIMKRRIAEGTENDERLNFYFQQAAIPSSGPETTTGGSSATGRAGRPTSPRRRRIYNGNGLRRSRRWSDPAAITHLQLHRSEHRSR